MLAIVSPEKIADPIAGDFHFTEAGEILSKPAIVCDSDPMGPCGCARSFSGLSSLRGTTLGVVADVPEEDIRLAAMEACLAGGWGEDLVDAFVEQAFILPPLVADMGLAEGALVRVRWSSDNALDFEEAWVELLEVTG